MKWCLVKQEKCYKKTGADCHLRALKTLINGDMFNLLPNRVCLITRLECSGLECYSPFSISFHSVRPQEEAQYKAELTVAIGSKFSKKNSNSAESGIAVEKLL